MRRLENMLENMGELVVAFVLDGEVLKIRTVNFNGRRECNIHHTDPSRDSPKPGFLTLTAGWPMGGTEA